MKLDIVRRDRLYDGFLKLDSLKIKLPNGKEINREVLKKPDVVAIVAITKEGEVYLAKQPRAGINNLSSIEIPAGIIEDDENPEIAAERELLEETGCKAPNGLISLGKYTGDPACCTTVTYLFLALNAEKVAELDLDDDEYLEAFAKPISEVYDMIENGEIMDANSIIGMERARKYLD